MLSWLRRSIGRLDRRWIRDPDERHRHDVQVRERLHGSTVTEPPTPSTEPEAAGRPNVDDQLPS